MKTLFKLRYIHVVNNVNASEVFDSRTAQQIRVEKTTPFHAATFRKLYCNSYVSILTWIGVLRSAATLTTHFPTQNTQSKHFHAGYDPNGPHIASVWGNTQYNPRSHHRTNPDAKRQKERTLPLTMAGKFSSTLMKFVER